MLVKMRREISGLRDGQPWPPVGGTIELTEDEAVTLVRNGMAEPVYDPEHRVETAVVSGEETRDALVPTTTRRTKERSRGKN